MKARQFFEEYSTIIVFDTEYTSWEGAQERHWSRENEYREVIQIAALKLDLKDCREIDSFERFVKPRINYELSDYIKNLTHITQAQIDDGVDFYDACTEFMAWTEQYLICSYGSGRTDPLKTPHPEGDGRILHENIDLYKIPVAYNASRFFNVAPFFEEAGIDTAAYTSGTLYKYFGLSMDESRAHNAMHDVQSLAASLCKLN